MTVTFRKTHPQATTPRYGSAGAAGADLFAVEGCVIAPREHRSVRTGIAVQLPPGFEGQVRPRSGLAFHHGVTVLNAPGTIDEDYRGEVFVCLVNHSRHDCRINAGDRIAQLVVAPVVRCTFDEAALSETERGEAGLGSTGR